MNARTDEFQRIGRRLCEEGLVGANFGNMSVRERDGFSITRTGSFLDSPGEPVFVPNEGEVPPSAASSECRLHREVYRTSSHYAIVHAHPPHAVALSLTEKEILPSNAESVYSMGTVPVLGWNTEIKAGGLADIIAEALTRFKIVMVHGHGSFAVGQLLEEAYNLTTALEEACHVLCLLKSFQKSLARK